MRSKAKILSSREQLGSTQAVSAFMGLGYTYLQAIKRVSELRHSESNPAPYLGMLTSAKRVEEWLERNRDFRVRLVYRRKLSPALRPEGLAP